MNDICSGSLADFGGKINSPRWAPFSAAEELEQLAEDEPVTASSVHF